MADPARISNTVDFIKKRLDSLIIAIYASQPVTVYYIVYGIYIFLYITFYLDEKNECYKKNMKDITLVEKTQ